MHHLVKDTEIAGILNSLFQIKGIHKKDIARLRNFIEAIYYMSRAGCSWRLLPSSYGLWRSHHKRFKQWCEKNIWKQVFENVQIEPDLEYLTIDSSKGYDSTACVENIISKGFVPIIPSRKNRKQPRVYDEFLYQDRNRIECFFGKIKHFRRIATRYDKCASSYLSFLYFVGTLIWLR